jgi:NADPH-dependent 2,4-dienoyl-CoA reductase/sulfur reductase-like enzyme
MEASALVIASGGREFVPAFPGWTLPGVMTLGGAQGIIKRHHVLPGHSMLIAGAGPLTWALAAETIEHGGNLLGVYDYSRPVHWLSILTQVSALRDRVGLALRYLRTITGQRVPYRWTRDRLHAHGEGRLERVSIGSKEFELDVLCAGFGFIPNTELLRLAGCSMTFDRTLGGWIPVVDEGLRTSRPGVYAAGECAGVGGAQKALLEGELAALSLLESLGQPLSSQADERRLWLRRRRRSELRFGRALNRSCEPPAGFLAGLEHEAIVCRCENVRAGGVKIAHSKGITTLDGLKNELRVGQGMCQGRTCGPILQRMLAADANPPVPFNVRPPVKPVALSQIEGRS